MYRICPGSELAKHQGSEQHPGTNLPEPRRLTASRFDCGVSAEAQHELWPQHSGGLQSTGSQGMPSYLEDHWMRDQEPPRKWACTATRQTTALILSDIALEMFTVCQS